MMNDFSTHALEVPEKPSRYFKLQEGENTFRILGNPLIGWEWWTEEDGKRTVHRTPKDGKIPNGTDPGTVKFFWALPVWNYDIRDVQILVLTQKTIQKQIQALANNAKWGNPLEYDLSISRSGKGLDTQYVVSPNPKEPLQKHIEGVFQATPLNLEALYENSDPFAA